MNIDNYTINKLKQDIENAFNEFLNKGNTLKFTNEENKYILETNINRYLTEQYINGNCADKLHCKVTYSSYNPSDTFVSFYNSNNELIETDEDLERCITGQSYVKYEIDLSEE